MAWRERDAEASPEEADDQRLDQKLRHDIVAPRAERLAQSDFPRSFGDGHQHDVHDANAANDQRDRCDAGKQERHDFAGFRNRVLNLGEISDLKWIFFGAGTVPLAHQRENIRLRAVHVVGVVDLNLDAVDVVLAEQPTHRGGNRNENRSS